MLTLKTPFAKTPLTASAPAADAKLKARQLAKGRTKARVESLTAEHDAVQLEVRQKQHDVGELRSEDQDTTGAIEELKQAQDRLGAIDAALVIATEKDSTAEAELKHAQQQLQIEKEVQALEKLKALGLRGDQVFESVKQLATDAAVAAEALRVTGGNEAYAFLVSEIRAQFDLFLGLAKHPLTNNGHVPTAFMKFKRWSDSVPDPESARTRKR